MSQAFVHPTASPSGRRHPMRYLARGFTLIEVMIVVAIIAILSAIAIPSYRDYILRGQLVDGTTLLAGTRANMERYYQDNRRYTAVSGVIVPPCDLSIPVAQRTQGNFVVTCSAIALNSFTLLATGSGAAYGFSYSIDERDARLTVSTGGSWPMPAPNTCWAVKRGQSC